MIDLIGQLGFTGNYEMSLDAKGRVTTPSPFIKVLQSRHAADEGNVVASLTPEMSVAIYPIPVWEAKQAKLDELTDLDESSRALRRMILANTFPSSLDGSNRLRLPQQLMSVCGIEKDVKIVGNNKFFEIWNKEAWDKYSDVGLKEMVKTSQKVLHQ